MWLGWAPPPPPLHFNPLTPHPNPNPSSRGDITTRSLDPRDPLRSGRPRSLGPGDSRAHCAGGGEGWWWLGEGWWWLGVGWWGNGGGRSVTVGHQALRSHPGDAAGGGEVSVCARGKQGLRVYLRAERQMTWICFKSERERGGRTHPHRPPAAPVARRISTPLLLPLRRRLQRKKINNCARALFPCSAGLGF